MSQEGWTLTQCEKKNIRYDIRGAGDGTKFPVPVSYNHAACYSYLLSQTGQLPLFDLSRHHFKSEVNTSRTVGL